MNLTLSSTDVDYVRRVVYEDSAIVLDDSKAYLVEARLSPLVEQQGVASITHLIRSMRAGSARLREAVVSAMTTNETTFYRDVQPFDALRDAIIPAVESSSAGRNLAIWSAAASTGQEAYSVAMLMADHFPHLSGAAILGTDVAADVVRRAACGRFTQLEVNRGLPTRQLVRHFTRDGPWWQISDQIRRRVSFRVLNLARPFHGVPTMDIVLLRNLLIYFDQPTRHDVLVRVAQVMRPGGYLLLGAVETVTGLAESFERVQVGKTVCYRRIQERSRT